MEVDDSAGDMDLFHEAGNLESNFYQEGYDGGFAHGRLHGLFEGRALGQEKAWEIWEEVGFYEGFAEYWLDMLSRLMHPAGPGASVGKSKESRAISQARQLIDMISSFPTINPSTSASTTSATPADPSGLPAPTEEDTADDPTDLPRLLSSIRAKYRLLCTSVGARPRLVAAAPAAASEMGAEGVDVGMDTGPGEGQNGSGQNQGQGQDYEQGGVVSGIEGPMKGVDTRQLRF